MPSFSGHVHNYQRFSREINGKRVPYIVAGAGGYANTPKSLHELQEGIDTSRLPYQTTHADVQLESANHDEPGYLLVTVTDTDITVDYFIVPFDGSSPSKFDTITI